MSDEDQPTPDGPELSVLRDMDGNVLRMEWTKGDMYFAFNGDEVQGAIDAMTVGLVSLTIEVAGQDTPAIALYKSAADASPGDFV